MEDRVERILGMHRHLVKNNLANLRWKLILELDPYHMGPSKEHIEEMLLTVVDFELDLLRCFADCITAEV